MEEIQDFVNSQQHNPITKLQFQKRQQKAVRSREAIQKLNEKQLQSLKNILKKETELWKQNIQKTFARKGFGPAIRVDKYRLPSQIEGVKQPQWVHTRRNFLKSLSFQERNLVLIGDPYLEYDPCTYVLLYSYPD